MTIHYASDLHLEFGMNSIYMPDTSQIQARDKQETSKSMAFAVSSHFFPDYLFLVWPEIRRY